MVKNCDRGLDRVRTRSDGNQAIVKRGELNLQLEHSGLNYKTKRFLHKSDSSQYCLLLLHVSPLGEYIMFCQGAQQEIECADFAALKPNDIAIISTLLRGCLCKNRPLILLRKSDFSHKLGFRSPYLVNHENEFYFVKNSN